MLNALREFFASSLVRIIVVSVFMTMMVSIILTSYLQAALRDQAMDRWIDIKSRSVISAALRIDTALESAQERLRFLAARPGFSSPPTTVQIDPALNGIAEYADPARREALNWLLHESEHGFRVLYVLLANGGHYISQPFAVQKNISLYNLSERPYFKEASQTKKLTLSDTFVGADGIPAVAMLLPIMDAAGTVHSYLGAVFDLTKLSGFIEESIQSVEQEVGFLLDRSGRLIAQQGAALDPKWQSLALPVQDSSTRWQELSHKGAEDRRYQISVQSLSADAQQDERIAVLAELKSGWVFGTVRDTASIHQEILPGIYRIVGFAALLINALGILVTWMIGVRWRASEQARVALFNNQISENEARFRTVTDTASDAIITVDVDQVIVYWNLAATQILGYDREEMLGQRLTCLIPEALRARHQDKFAMACNSGCLQSGGQAKAVSALRKNGDTIPIELTMSTWEEKGQRFFTSFIRDISQRHQQEATIRTLSLAVQQSPASIVIANLEGEIEFVNQAFSQISGYELGEVLGQNPRLFQSGQTPDSTYQELWGNISSGLPWQGEMLNRKKSGELFWEYARISPVVNDAGVMTHYMAIKEDISQLKRSERELRTSLRLRKTLSACNQSLVRSDSEKTFLERLCDAIVTEGEYPFAWVGYAEDAYAEQLQVQMRAGDDRGYLSHFDNQQLGAYIAGDAIRLRRPLLGYPALQSPPSDWELKGVECGFKSSIALPVVNEAYNLYAVLRIYSHDPSGFSEDEQVLLLELAEDLRYGIVSHRTRMALNESAAQFRSLAEDSMVGVYMIRDKRFVYVNPRLAEIFGFASARDMMGLEAIEVVATDDRSKVLRNLHRGLNHRTPSIHYEFTGQRKDGQQLAIEIFGSLTQHDGQSAVVGSLLDVTLRSQQTEHLRMLQRALEASNEGIAISDHRLPDNPIIYVNPAFESITGYSEEDTLGRNGRFLLGDNPEQVGLDTLSEAIHTGRAAQVQLQNYRQDGSLFWNQLSVAPVRDDDSKLTHYVSIVQDITERRDYMQQLEQLTHFDPLTGLANRTLLKDRLAQSLIHAKRMGRLAALIVLDLNRFKTIAHTLGAQDAELILVTVGQRLTAQVRKGDTVARIGNDQFAVLLDDLERESNLPDLVLDLLNAIEVPLDIGLEGLCITCTVGVVIAPADGNTFEQLLDNCHAALLKAYADNQRHRFFTSQMNEEASKRLELVTDLRKAVEENQFVLFYQPKIRLEDGRIIGSEALIRWQHPIHGLLFPDLFIPLAEETGMIRAIGEWVLKEACSFTALLNNTLPEPLSIAVNFSVEQFKDLNLCNKIAQVLKVTGLPSHLLECELTESLLMSDPQGAVILLNEIKSMGALIALDDFGTGYSSLSYLKRFPIDTLKIDRSFVMDTPNDEHDVAIVKSIIALAESLNLYVVAEGVETLEQAQFLLNLGCQSVQGYYFSKPIPALQFENLVQRQEEYVF